MRSRNCSASLERLASDNLVARDLTHARLVQSTNTTDSMLARASVSTGGEQWLTELTLAVPRALLGSALGKPGFDQDATNVRFAAINCLDARSASVWQAWQEFMSESQAVPAE
jgi:hypothetical protein